MRLTTERLLLRPWEESDAESLFRWAQDPRVGPIAGWPVHKSAEESRTVIREVLSFPECYAVVPKGESEPVGSIGLMIGGRSNQPLAEDEAEIGYWIAVPYWGRGLIPEAVEALLRRAFMDLGLKTVWCGYFDGNDKSRRVQEKCGFIYERTERDAPWPAMGDVRTEHITKQTRPQWLARMEKAKTK